MTENERISQLHRLLDERILILDGATGTVLQKFGFQDSDFRRGPFQNHPCELAGDNDALNLTRPDAVLSVHTQYLEAGADIIETNTFGSNAVSQAAYSLSAHAYKLSRAGAAIARSAADAFSERTPDKIRFVAGSIGPTGKSLSMSPSAADPAFRDLTFEELSAAYETQAAGLLDGGADILLIETAFDTLNVKAAIAAVSRLNARRGRTVPLMISGTISDASGRLLAGQTPEAFLISVSHAPHLLSIGLNCALGAEEMRPHLAALAAKAPFFISAYPNAGLPDEQGRYHQTPDTFARIMRSFAEESLLNIAGGCCGTTPDHIRALAENLHGLPPRRKTLQEPGLKLAGLDPLVLRPGDPFLNIGERTNVAGSRKFLNLIREGNADEAVRVAVRQIKTGAAVIDVNMDDALLDAKSEMRRFLLRIAAEPEAARVPVMIDSSSWEVVRIALECLPGKGVVNSISLKEGKEKFLEHAREAVSFGAALLCMAFDENGQADTVEKRLSVCRRMYRLLTEDCSVSPDDIIFDVNVFAAATGMPEHDSCARDFIEAVRILKREMPRCHFSGGISNVSFSFRGNNFVRSALHSVFLYHAIRAGLDMGIVNAAQLIPYDELDPELRAAAEAVILNTSSGAAEKLLAIASKHSGGPAGISAAPAAPAWRSASLEKRILHALVSGDDSFLADDMAEALRTDSEAVKVLEGPLMNAMREVGVRFGEGRMFLPQVVKSARVMKSAVSFLMPETAEEKEEGQGRAADDTRPVIVLATVKGDVHDIGKNIVGIVLRCNHFRVVDLGVMVPCEKIVETAIREHACLIGLSGLITPSLAEMGLVADELERRGLKIPLMVGGAAASALHTALKLQNRYSAPVVYTSDASQCAPAALALVHPEKRGTFLRGLYAGYEKLRRDAEKPHEKLLPFTEAVRQGGAFAAARPAPPPECTGILPVRVETERVIPFLNWNSFLQTWKLGASPDKEKASEELLADAKRLLALLLEKQPELNAVLGIFPAGRTENDILLYADESRKKILRTLPMLRRQTAPEKGGAGEGIPPLSLADFIAPENDHCGLFALTAGNAADALAKKFLTRGDEYSALLLRALAGRLAEAFAEHLHFRVRTEFWGYAPEESKTPPETLFAGRCRGIRPAIGYPSCPDHTLKRDLFDLLGAEERLGVTLTENCMMSPEASVCALIFAGDTARYFRVGAIGDDQLRDYAARRGMTPSAISKFLA